MATIDLLTPSFWDSCKHNKSLVFDFKARKMAIYANDAGGIVFVALDSEDAIVTEIDVAEVLPIVKMLFKALLEAEHISEKSRQEYLDIEEPLAAGQLISSKTKNSPPENEE